MLLRELREQVVYYGRQLLQSGLTMHTGGNLSARDPDSGLIAIKPTGQPYDLLTAGDISVIDPEGRLLEGLRPSSEWPMHTLIYRAYPDVGGVVHCHSLYATAASAAGREIPLCSHDLCLYCSSPVRVAPFAMPGSAELGESALAALGEDNCAALLESHGPITMGADLWHAFDAACAVERAAQILSLEAAFGPMKILPPEGRAALRACDPLQRKKSSAK